MEKIRKSIRTMLLLITAISLMIPSASVIAKSKVTDAKLKKVMKCYNNILATDPYKGGDGGFTAKNFSLKDLDQDGVPELIINDNAPQIFSYDLKNDKEMFLFNPWVICTLYYSEKTKNILYYYEWDGKKEWYFYNVNDTQSNDEFNVLSSLDELYSYTDGKYYEGAEFKPKKGYYKGSYWDENAKKETKASVDAAIKKLVPNKVKLEGKIKNTAANRKKYLGDLKQFKKSF